MGGAAFWDGEGGAAGGVCSPGGHPSLIPWPSLTPTLDSPNLCLALHTALTDHKGRLPNALRLLPQQAGWRASRAAAWASIDGDMETARRKGTQRSRRPGNRPQAGCVHLGQEAPGSFPPKVQTCTQGPSQFLAGPPWRARYEGLATLHPARSTPDLEATRGLDPDCGSNSGPGPLSREQMPGTFTGVI